MAEETDTRSVVDRAALPLMSTRKREMPNLSECHSCGYRINNAGNGQDRLRTLNSEWRIVLLCGKCYRRSMKGECCTYCLGEVGEEERFRCGECYCSVHWDCVSKFSEFAPWSYFDRTSSAICVDCWLPIKVQKLWNVQNGIISKFVGNGNKKVMGGGEKNARIEKRAQLVAKPPHVMLKGSENCSAKALVVEQAGIGKENHGDSLVATGKLGQKGKRIDDAELAFQLHRVMNRSSRISWNRNDVRKVSRWGCKNVSSVKTSALGQKNCIGQECLSAFVIEGFDSNNESAKVVLKEEQGSCSNNSSESFSWKELDLPKPELKFTYARRQCMSSFDGRPNQYMFKYTRKRSRLSELVACKYTYLYDRSTYESEKSSTGIVLHSSTESRNFLDSSFLDLPISDSANGSSQNNV